VSPDFDAQGCLTAEAFARIAAAPPGRAPAELAAHLASCVRCQRRLLASASASPSRAAAARRPPPPVWRTAVVVAACVVLVVIALILLRTLTASPL